MLLDIKQVLQGCQHHTTQEIQAGPKKHVCFRT